MFIGAAQVILDFYGNVEIKTKRQNIAALLEDLHKKFNVSATEVADFDDTERCVLGVSLVAGTAAGAQAAIKKTLEYIDSNSFARVAMEDSDVLPYELGD